MILENNLYLRVFNKKMSVSVMDVIVSQYQESIFFDY